MKKNILNIGPFIFGIAINFASADEGIYLGRSPKALLMGDAYTAIADDEFTLFYNPAALGKNKGVAINAIEPQIMATNLVSDTSRFKNFPSGSNAAPQIADRILNFPVFVNLGLFPSAKMGQIAFSVFASRSASFVLRNATNPEFDLKYKDDKGFIFGYSQSFGSGALMLRTRKSDRVTASSGKRFTVGASLKKINREGVKGNFDLFGTNLLSKVTAGSTDFVTITEAFGFSKGTGIGADLGVEFAQANGRNLFTTGLSILDVGDTHFKKTSGTGTVPKQDMTVNFGVAFKQNYTFLDYTISADLHPMNAPIDFGQKFHLGTEISLPLLTLYGGFSEGYLSYGTSVKFWPIKVTVGFYNSEVGSHYKEQQSSRMIVYVSLFDFSIDL